MANLYEWFKSATLQIGGLSTCEIRSPKIEMKERVQSTQYKEVERGDVPHEFADKPNHTANCRNTRIRERSDDMFDPFWISHAVSINTSDYFMRCDGEASNSGVYRSACLRFVLVDPDIYFPLVLIAVGLSDFRSSIIGVVYDNDDFIGNTTLAHQGVQAFLNVLGFIVSDNNRCNRFVEIYECM